MVFRHLAGPLSLQLKRCGRPLKKTKIICGKNIKTIYNTKQNAPLMSETQDKKDIPPDQPQRAGRESPLDTRLLSEAVIELNISRKNVGIYPPGHVQITKSIDRAYDLLLKLFEIRSEMTLGVAKDTLLVGQDYLDQKNPVYRDFALSMNQQGIAAVTFVSGLAKEELVKFHRILTTKLEDIRASGGIGSVMAEAGILHIRIQVIDFRSFHVTEEQEIVRSQGKPAGEKSDAGLWQDFVTHLSAGTLAGSGEQGVSVKDAEQFDPAELARLLNERKLDSDAALQSYDRIISDYVRGRAEKKQLTHEQSATLANMNKLLQDLHPELRKQFLSVAFRRISSHASTADADALVGGFQDDMVIDMLRQASAEGKEISPTLTGLLGKLTKAHAQGETAAPAQGPDVDVSTGTRETPLILPEHMEKLFDREMYEDYVGEDYEAMLKRLTEGPGVSQEQFSIEEFSKTLEDEYLDFQIGRALLAFMAENIDEEDYKELAQKLIAIMPGFLKTGNFFLLWDIFETLRRHTTEKPVKAIREIAEEARKSFTSPEFKAKALDAFEIWMKDKGQEAAGFIQALGSDTVPGLMDIFSRDESVGGRRIVFNLLCIFGAPAVREAHKRLRDSRVYYVKNLLMFLRRAGNQTSIAQVKPLLQHENPGVRMEALNTLLKLKDPGAVKTLSEVIHSPDPDLAFQAIALAGQYRVREVVESILSKIKRAVLFETDYRENAEIIKALGEIGDPRAIRDLEKLARASWTLYPQGLVRMKEQLFDSLERYPQDSVTELLKIGERSENENILRACRKLRERK
jgi:hypothetical protein